MNVSNMIGHNHAKCKRERFICRNDNISKKPRVCKNREEEDQLNRDVSVNENNLNATQKDNFGEMKAEIKEEFVDVIESDNVGELDANLLQTKTEEDVQLIAGVSAKEQNINGNCNKKNFGEINQNLIQEMSNEENKQFILKETVKRIDIDKIEANNFDEIDQCFVKEEVEENLTIDIDDEHFVKKRDPIHEQAVKQSARLTSLLLENDHPSTPDTLQPSSLLDSLDLPLAETTCPKKKAADEVDNEILDAVKKLNSFCDFRMKRANSDMVHSFRKFVTSTIASLSKPMQSRVMQQCINIVMDAKRKEENNTQFNCK